MMEKGIHFTTIPLTEKYPLLAQLSLLNSFLDLTQPKITLHTGAG